MKQFSMDREQNSVKIADLKTFLDRNIDIMKNNWDDKRNVEIQAGESMINKKPIGTTKANVPKCPSSLWQVIEEYIDSNGTLKQGFESRVSSDDISSVWDSIQQQRHQPVSLDLLLIETSRETKRTCNLEPTS